MIACWSYEPGPGLSTIDASCGSARCAVLVPNALPPLLVLVSDFSSSVDMNVP